MGQIACVGPFQHGYTGIVANSPIQLAIAHVNGVHVPGAVLQKHVREPAGSRANIHGYRISHIRAKHAQRFIQLERPTAHKGVRMAAYRQCFALLHLFRGLENLDLPAVDLPRHDKRLGLFTAGGQPLPHQRLIHPQLIGHCTRPPL